MRSANALAELIPPYREYTSFRMHTSWAALSVFSWVLANMYKWSQSYTALSACRGWTAIVGLSFLCLLPACSDGNGNNNAYAGEQFPEENVPFAELYEQGISRYLGQYTPMLSEQDSLDSGVINHYFGAGDGPLCREGAEYSMATRDVSSQELVIFLEGGGACWSDLCASNTEAVSGITAVGILDPQREDNPVKDWNQVFVPYCDGSLHAGDVDIDTDGDGRNDRFQRGLHNLSAALDVAVNTFPAPRRILLTGESGGGLGTTFALALVRKLYPDAAIEVINDSGVGVGRPDQPEFLRQLLDEWNLGAFFPASCPNCIPEDGHLTDYLIWQMDQDETLRRGMLSYSRDTVFADFFLQIGKDAFEVALFEEMPQLEEAHPERSHYWIPAGEKHTFIRAEPDQTAGGVPVLDWIGYMLDDSDEWVSVQD